MKITRRGLFATIAGAFTARCLPKPAIEPISEFAFDSVVLSLNDFSSLYIAPAVKEYARLLEDQLAGGWHRFSDKPVRMRVRFDPARLPA